MACCVWKGAWQSRHHSPTVVAIAAAAGFLVVFSIVVAGERIRIMVLPSLFFFFLLLRPTKSPARSSIFSVPWFGSTNSSSFLFSLSFLLLQDFYLNLLVLVFILVGHRRSSWSCCGFAYVLGRNDFIPSLLANCCCDSGLLQLFSVVFFLLMQRAFFSPDPRGSLPYVMLQAFSRI